MTTKIKKAKTADKIATEMEAEAKRLLQIAKILRGGRRR